MAVGSLCPSTYIATSIFLPWFLTSLLSTSGNAKELPGTFFSNRFNHSRLMVTLVASATRSAAFFSYCKMMTWNVTEVEECINSLVIFNDDHGPACVSYFPLLHPSIISSFVMPVRALGRWALLQKNSMACYQQPKAHGVPRTCHLALEDQSGMGAEVVTDMWVLLETLNCIQAPTSREPAVEGGLWQLTLLSFITILHLA